MTVTGTAKRRWNLAPARTPWLALGVAIALGACTGLSPSNARPRTIYEPDLAGPIRAEDHDGATNTYTVTVRGQTFDIGPDARVLSGTPSGTDTLLIYGTDGETIWYVSLGKVVAGSQAGCYVMNTYNAWDAGDSIIFGFPLNTDQGVETGVVLQKAPEWTQTWDASIDVGADDRYPVKFRAWCLDAAGQVKSVEERAAG